MKNEKKNSPTPKSNKTPLWILGSLLVLAFAGMIYFASQSTKYKTDSTSLSMKLDDLNVEKETMTANLETLNSSYEEQIASNENLSAELEQRVLEVDGLKKKISSARALLKESKSENEEIKERIAQMEELKVKLEEDILKLEERNNALVATNDEINNELERANEEISVLNNRIVKMENDNTALTSRLYQLAPAGFVAENFNVFAEKRNDKLTSKANRTDEIKVQFDIKNVPMEYQKDEEIYIVVTEFDGNPVEEIQSKKVTINSQEPIKVDAAAIEKMALKDKQNIVMSFETGKNLESGRYNVLVYADHGFLGATSFTLN